MHFLIGSQVIILVYAYVNLVRLNIPFVFIHAPFIVLDDTSICAYGSLVFLDLGQILLDIKAGGTDIISICACFKVVLVYLHFVIVDIIWVGWDVNIDWAYGIIVGDNIVFDTINVISVDWDGNRLCAYDTSVVSDGVRVHTDFQYAVFDSLRVLSNEILIACYCSVVCVDIIFVCFGVHLI